MKSAREKLREVYDMPGMPEAARVIIGDVMSSLNERPEGEWIYEAVYHWHRCSICKKVYPEILMQQFNECQYQPRFDFCPNCGSRMR